MSATITSIVKNLLPVLEDKFRPGTGNDREVFPSRFDGDYGYDLDALAVDIASEVSDILAYGSDTITFNS